MERILLSPPYDQPYNMELTQTPTNQKKVAQLEAAVQQILSEILQRGFHGSAQIALSVQDGTVQHIRRVVERIER